MFGKKNVNKEPVRNNFVEATSQKEACDVVKVDATSSLNLFMEIIISDKITGANVRYDVSFNSRTLY